MSELLNTVLIADNTFLHILGFTFAVALTLVLSKVLRGTFRKTIVKRVAESETKLDDLVLETFEKPVQWVALVGGLGLSFKLLVLPEVFEQVVASGTTFLVTIFCAWTATNFVKAARKTYIDPFTDASENRLDDQLVPIMQRTLVFVIWTLAALMILSNLGYDIVSVLTGLGIGGLALAMAAQDTLANVFGSLTIFADKPFQVDDVVNIGGHTGTVTDVGLRTCRVRTFEDTLVTVPNKMLVGSTVENLSAREARKFSGTIGLVYETTSEQLEAAMDALKGILEAEETIRDGYAVRFDNFGDSALELTVLYWVDPVSEYFSTRNRVNLAIKKSFDENGWDMAFPSMTVYRGAA
ncbi:MAG: MscS family membrane protein [Bradymonadia bacterium]|jgi:MscS family membrane protein